MKHSLQDKRIVVTGGAGFIGSHIVDALVAQQAKVTVIDNLSTGNLENITHLLDRITFIKGDITDANLCTIITKHTDIVFHLAAQISVPESMQYPHICHDINVSGTFNMLEACRKNKVTRFIFSSSAAVYGNHEGICSEEMVCTPLSPYGMSKLIGEQYCQLYSALYGLETVCLRYFNVYGPRQNALSPHAGFVARIRHQMAQQQPITIYGDGQQTRDFIPVQSVVSANLLSAQCSKNYAQGHPINVGSGKSIPLISMIETIKKTEFPEYSQPIVFHPPRSGDIRFSQANREKLSQLENTHL